jgi:hypothetical protein
MLGKELAGDRWMAYVIHEIYEYNPRRFKETPSLQDHVWQPLNKRVDV